ncbi:regulatory protein [Geomicrobium halophilum]|uniref:Regulatory protein RecX n=1 Tax=Geomicrobium halophilum TaxID=549000 RepID=A0A841PPE4_9BACL|nr:regulatory protein [Geomicrobium halophilum]
MGDHIKISRITTQKDDSKRYNLFIEDHNGERFACGVHEIILARMQLTKGKSITDDELEEIIQADNKEKAKKQALQYLSKRMRTEAEVRDKLQEQDLPPDHIDEAINSMIWHGYINDAEYARTYVRVTISTTDKGPGRIRQYLNEKGIHPSLIDEALEQYDEEIQVQMMLKIIEKKEKTIPKDSLVLRKKKLTDALLRKGYSHSLIQTAFEAYDFHSQGEEEWEALRLQAEKAEFKLRKRHEEEAFKQKLKEHLYRKGFTLTMIDQYLDEQEEKEVY